MKEPHIEGTATHDDPESCSDGREAGAEALTGARAGTDIEPRKQASREPTPLSEAEGNTGSAASVRRHRPCAVEDPAHARNLAAREPGDPNATRG
jgi:hypothetical protein